MKAGADSALVAQLVAAHRGAHLVAPTNALVPRDLVAAYQTQAHIAEALDADIGGWKVGIRPDGTAMTAPIYAHLMKTSGATWLLPKAGRLIVEVELALRLAVDLPVRTKSYSHAEIAGAVGEVLIGVEMIQSRFAGDEFPAFPAFLADNLGNAGYVLGGALRNFRTFDLAKLRCTMTLDGNPAHDKVGGHPQDDPYAPVIACLAQGMMGLGGFRAGQILTTGSLITPLKPAGPIAIRAELAGIGGVEVAVG